MKTITYLILISFIFNACGGNNRGGVSSFDVSAQFPILDDTTKYFVEENTKEAFLIKATDKSLLSYFISGKDAQLLHVDIFTGEVFFKEVTDFETKSKYSLKVTVEDSVKHRTSKDVEIFINDNNEDTHPIIVEENLTASFDDAESNKLFITTWKTDNPGKSDRNQITIPTWGDGYNYSVDWGDGSSSHGLTKSATHTYKTIGTYTVKIKGDFPRISFSKNYGSSDAEKILSIEQWGQIEWTSMAGAFAGCGNLVGKARDVPNLSKVENMEYMFLGAKNFNQDIGNWNVSNITNMLCIFGATSSFNQDIGRWDVGKVTNMVGAFFGASAFNQSLKKWNLSNTTDMNRMFFSASSFNQDIGNWNVSKVRNMSNMFAKASAFNQDIGSWNVARVGFMDSMFFKALSFNQDLEAWKVDEKAYTHAMFDEMPLSENTPSWYKDDR